jgi:hypothetical protein
MAQTQYKPRSVDISEWLALIPVLLLISWVIIRALV